MTREKITASAEKPELFVWRITAPYVAQSDLLVTFPTNDAVFPDGATWYGPGRIDTAGPGWQAHLRWVPTRVLLRNRTTRFSSFRELLDLPHALQRQIEVSLPGARRQYACPATAAVSVALDPRSCVPALVGFFAIAHGQKPSCLRQGQTTASRMAPQASPRMAEVAPCGYPDHVHPRKFFRSFPTFPPASAAHCSEEEAILSSMLMLGAGVALVVVGLIARRRKRSSKEAQQGSDEVSDGRVPSRLSRFASAFLRWPVFDSQEQLAGYEMDTSQTALGRAGAPLQEDAARMLANLPSEGKAAPPWFPGRLRIAKRVSKLRPALT